MINCGIGSIGLIENTSTKKLMPVLVIGEGEGMYYTLPILYRSSGCVGRNNRLFGINIEPISSFVDPSSGSLSEEYNEYGDLISKEVMIYNTKIGKNKRGTDFVALNKIHEGKIEDFHTMNYRISLEECNQVLIAFFNFQDKFGIFNSLHESQVKLFIRESQMEMDKYF